MDISGDFASDFDRERCTVWEKFFCLRSICAWDPSILCTRLRCGMFGMLCCDVDGRCCARWEFGSAGTSLHDGDVVRFRTTNACESAFAAGFRARPRLREWPPPSFIGRQLGADLPLDAGLPCDVYLSSDACLPMDAGLPLDVDRPRDGGRCPRPVAGGENDRLEEGGLPPLTGGSP